MTSMVYNSIKISIKEDVMDDVKLKASEYASLMGLSLNTVKNRIRAGVLRGAKEEDGVWYVYLSQEDYEHLTNTKRQRESKELQIRETVERLKSSLEGSLIATYIELQIAKDMQKEELLHELSSLYTLLAVKEKEIEFLRKEVEKTLSELTKKEEETKRFSDEIKHLEKENKRLETSLREKELQLSQRELDFQRAMLEKDREILQKDMEIERLKSGLRS